MTYRDLDPYLEDEHLTEEQRELKRLRQLDQNMAIGEQDIDKIRMMKMQDQANHMRRTRPSFVAKLRKLGKSPEQFILDAGYRPDLTEAQYEKGETELLGKMYGEDNKLRLAPNVPTQQRDEDFWGDKPPGKASEDAVEAAKALNELQKANPDKLTCDKKVELQFTKLISRK